MTNFIHALAYLGLMAVSISALMYWAGSNYDESIDEAKKNIERKNPNDYEPVEDHKGRIEKK